MKNIFLKQKACPQCLKHIFSRRGISLIEVLAIIAIIGIIVAITSSQFSGLKNQQVLKTAGADIISSINKAQTQTRASLNSSSYGMHFQSDKVVIFKGTTYSANDANNQNVNLTSPATISNISLTGGVSDIYFNRLTGLPSKTGTITISNGSLTKTITISATGMASIN